MTFEDVAEEMVKWARGLIPDLKDGYSYPAGITERLPDVAVVIGGVKDVAGDKENFPFESLEQTWLRVFDVEVSIMVEVEEGAEGERVAQRALEGYAETLMGSTQTGTSLGNEAMISPRVETDLTEPAEQRTGGLRGRTVYLKMAVGQRLEIG